MYFMYDSVGFTEATIIDGSYSSNTFSNASSDTIDNEDRINDQSISLAVTSYVGTDAIRIDYGSAVSVSSIALYMNAAETDDIFVARSSDGTNGATIASLTTNFNANAWQVNDFSESTYRYFFLGQGTGSATFTGLTEVILGKKLSFEMNPDVGIAEQEIFGTEIQRSIGGVEFGTQTHNPISTFSLNFSSISQTFKNNLQTFESAVTNRKKFLWYDDSAFNYVRLDAPIAFTEVAFERYSASLSLREQLS